MAASWHTAATATTSATSAWVTSSGSTCSVTWDIDDYCYGNRARQRFIEGPTQILPGAGDIKLPDGALLVVDKVGNYHIDDKNAKVTYKANRIREFSPHLNASDLVAAFLTYAGKLGVRAEELMKLPLELFIAWLVIEAASRDGDPIPEDVRVESHPRLLGFVRPRCLKCGQFIKRLRAINQFPFCSSQHGALYLEHQEKAE